MAQRVSPAAGRASKLATTRWSLVFRAADRSSTDAASALSALCEIYWYPVYVFVRRRVHSVEDAKDLTQAFFARLLEREFLATADPRRGRFRAFLLTAVQHFLANEYDHRHAQKRGGGRSFVPLEFDGAEDRYCAEPAALALTPEELYNRRWALTLLNDALCDLQSEAAARDWEQRLAELQPLVLGDGSYSEIAGRLDMSEGALRVAVHRLRRRFAAAIRRRIADTVSDPGEIDAEIAYLMQTLGRRPSGDRPAGP